MVIALAVALRSRAAIDVQTAYFYSPDIKFSLLAVPLAYLVGQRNAYEALFFDYNHRSEVKL